MGEQIYNIKTNAQKFIKIVLWVILGFSSLSGSRIEISLSDGTEQNRYFHPKTGAKPAHET
jgi:hypothetical protein